MQLLLILFFLVFPFSIIAATETDSPKILDILSTMPLSNHQRYCYDELIWCHDYFETLDLIDQVALVLFLTLKCVALENDSKTTRRQKALNWAFSRTSTPAYDQCLSDYKSTQHPSAKTVQAITAHDAIIARNEQNYAASMHYRLEFTRRSLECAQELLNKKLLIAAVLMQTGQTDSVENTQVAETYMISA